MSATILFRILITALPGAWCAAQRPATCIVYQFAGKDSTRKHAALISRFNPQGRVVSETYSNYKESSIAGISDGTAYYVYTDTLLTEKLFIDDKRDTLKTVYRYNALRQCTRQTSFSCQRRLKKGMKSDAVFGSDYEPHRTWMKTNEVTFVYDEKGRTIKKTDEQDYTRTWEYDAQNRIVREQGYSHGRLTFAEEYSYNSRGYQYATVYYDYTGRPNPASYEDSTFNPIYTTAFYLDRKGRVTEERVSTERGVQISTKRTFYNAKGQVVKTVHRYTDKHFIRPGEAPEITHIFEYR